MAGIKNGFPITNKGCKIAEAEAKNHKSATLHSRRTLVEKELKTQIELGNYVIASEKPAIMSPLGAISKDDGSVRLIHDGSLPEGFSMNEYTDHHSVPYQTLQDACRLAKPVYFCAKLDLQSAYRSVPIQPDDYKATGLAWRFQGEDTDTYLFDARLPFALACGPSHFSRLSNAIRRMMYRKGYKGVVSYIDDFLLACETYEECKEALLYLINLLES